MKKVSEASCEIFKYLLVKFSGSNGRPYGDKDTMI